MLALLLLVNGGCLLLSLFWRGLELVPKRQMRHREAHHVTEGLAAPLLLSFLSALGLELLVLDTTREDDLKTHQMCKKKPPKLFSKFQLPALISPPKYLYTNCTYAANAELTSVSNFIYLIATMQQQSVRNQILNKPILLPLMTSDTTIGCYYTTCEQNKTTTKPNVRVMGSHGKSYRNFLI